MKKERLETLKRLKTLALALIIMLSLSGCKNEEKGYEGVDNKNNQSQENNENITAIFFIEDKALIYTGDEAVVMNRDYSYIAETYTKFSSGVEIVKTRTLEDAIELATAIVGEENIIYFDYNENGMVISHKKTK